MAEEAQPLQEVTVTRDDGTEYSVQVSEDHRKQMEAAGMQLSGSKKMPVEEPETKKAPAAKNKARTT